MSTTGSPPPGNGNLSLLDDESPQGSAEPPSPPSSVPQDESVSYKDVLEQAEKWKTGVEKVRDGLMILRMQNAILLDSLTMAGAAL